MKLKVIGSGSSGNCYVLQDKAGKCLILEAGIPWSKVEKSVGFKPSNVAGALITHEHVDHAQYVDQFIKNGVKLYMTVGTAASEDLNLNSHQYNMVIPDGWYKIRSTEFTYKAFYVVHDAAEPVNYMIHHPEMGVMLFVTDTQNIDDVEGEATHWLIEANYEYKWLMESERPNKERVIAGHMSIEETIRTLQRMKGMKSESITLCHLSGDNGQADQFAHRVKNALDIEKLPNVAKAGLEVEL